MKKIATVCFLVFTMIAMSGCALDTWLKGTIDKVAGNSTGAVSADIVSAVNSSNEDAGVVKRHSEDIGEKTDSINGSADRIDQENAEIAAATDDPNILESTTVIRDEVVNIKQDTTSIQGMLKGIDARVEEIRQSNQDIINSNFEVEKLEEANRELLSEKEKLAEQAKARLYKMLYWFLGAGFAITVAGGVICIWERKIGKIILGIGAMTMVLAIASTVYFEYIALIGGITLGLAFFGTVGLLIWRYRNKIFETEEVDNGVNEIVQFIEKAVKPHLSATKRQMIFGNGGLADQYQSKATKMLVSKKRNTIDQEPADLKKDKKTG